MRWTRAALLPSTAPCARAAQQQFKHYFLEERRWICVTKVAQHPCILQSRTRAAAAVALRTRSNSSGRLSWCFSRVAPRSGRKTVRPRRLIKPQPPTGSSRCCEFAVSRSKPGCRLLRKHVTRLVQSVGQFSRLPVHLRHSINRIQQLYRGHTWMCQSPLNALRKLPWDPLEL